MPLIPHKQVDLEAIEELLQENGLSKSDSNLDTHNRILTLLENNQAGLPDTVGVLAHLMNNSKKDAVKLKAVQMVLQLNGELQKDTGGVQENKIAVLIAGGENELKIFNPKDRREDV